MKLACRDQFESMSQPEFARYLGVSTKTISRWRTKGRIVTLPNGRTEVILLKSINTAGARRPGGKVLISMSHDSFSHGFHVLGAAEFVEVLGNDPALALMELQFLEL